MNKIIRGWWVFVLSLSFMISTLMRAGDLERLKEFEAQNPPEFQVDLEIPSGAACREATQTYDSKKIYAVTKLVTSGLYNIKKWKDCPTVPSAPRLADAKRPFIEMFKKYVKSNCRQGDVSKLMLRFLELCISSEVSLNELTEFLRPLDNGPSVSKIGSEPCDISSNSEVQVRNLASFVSDVNEREKRAPLLTRMRSQSLPTVLIGKRPPHVVPTLFSEHDLNEQIKSQEAMRLSLGLPEVRGKDAEPKNIAMRSMPFDERLSEKVNHAKPMSKEFFDGLPLLEKEALLQRVEGEVEIFLKLVQGDHSKDSMLKRRLTYMALQWQLSNIELSAEAALKQNQTKSDMQGLGSAGMKKLLNSLVPPSTLKKMVRGEFKGSEEEKPKIAQINAAIMEILDSQKSLRDRQAIGISSAAGISATVHWEQSHFIAQNTMVSEFKSTLEEVAGTDQKKRKAIDAVRNKAEFKDLVDHDKTGLVVLNAERGEQDLVLFKVKQYHHVNNDTSKGALGSSFSWHYFSTYAPKGSLNKYLERIREEGLDGQLEFILRTKSGKPQVYARGGESKRYYLLGDEKLFEQGDLFDHEVNSKHGSVPILDFRPAHP